MGPILDLCITFLELGKAGLQRLFKERKELFQYTKDKVQSLLAKYGETLIENKSNKISMAMTLSKLAARTKKDVTAFGAYLYTRRVSGVKVVARGKKKAVCGIEFSNYGSHTETYSQLPYMAFAVAIGCRKEEVELFLVRLEKAITHFFVEDKVPSLPAPAAAAAPVKTKPDLAAKEKKTKPQSDVEEKKQ